MKKALFIIAVIIALIIAGLTVFVKTYVTSERVMAYIIPEAEKALNRKVSVGAVNINIFKGIDVKDFVIKEADERTDFVSCRNFVLQFKFWPLLSKKLIIDELRLESPQILLSRGKDGRFNYEDIGTSKDIVRPDAKKEAEGTEPLPISLLISSVRISSAKLTMIDLKKELPDITGSLDIQIAMKSISGSDARTSGTLAVNIEKLILHKPERREISNITAEVDYTGSVNIDSYDITIDKADVRVQEMAASVKGTVQHIRTKRVMDISLSLPNLQLNELEKIMSQFSDTGDLKMTGTMTADINLSGTADSLDNLKSDGTLAFKEVVLNYNKANYDISGNLSLGTVSDNATIKNATLVIAGIPLSLQGDIKGMSTSPRLNVKVQIPKTDAAKIQKAAASVASVDDLKTSGSLSADIHIQGETKNPEALQAEGTVVMDSLGIEYQGIKTALNGRADMKKDIVNVDITGTVGEDTASLKGTVKSPFKNQNINLNVYAKKLNLDQLIALVPSNGKESAKSGQPSQKKGADLEAEPLDLTLTAKGEIKVDSALYKGLSVDNFYGSYSYVNNRLVISDMTGTIGKGSFKVNSEVDLSKPGYAYKLSSTIKAFEAEKFVNAFFPKAKDTVFGLLAMNVNLRGTGTLPSSIKKNISGTADFTLQDGKLTNTGLSERFAGFLEMNEMETIILKDAKGTVKIRDGVARLDSLFSSDDFLMGPLGNIGLNETLDLAFDLKLAPRLMDKAMSSKIGKYFKNQEGWGVIPVIVTGTLTDPSYKVDMDKAGRQIIQKETDKLIDKLFEKKGEEKQQEMEPVKELLKGIFK
jgi:AsmA protein